MMKLPEIQTKNIQRGEIYLADLTGYVGAEQSGKRPILVIQNDCGNTHSPTTVIAPLTTKRKRRLPTHVVLTLKDCGISRRSTVLCEQVRVIDKSRLIQLLGKVENPTKLEEINRALRTSMDLDVA